MESPNIALPSRYVRDNESTAVVYPCIDQSLSKQSELPWIDRNYTIYGSAGDRLYMHRDGKGSTPKMALSSL
jgi:hypothetical protein